MKRHDARKQTNKMRVASISLLDHYTTPFVRVPIDELNAASPVLGGMAEELGAEDAECTIVLDGRGGRATTALHNILLLDFGYSPFGELSREELMADEALMLTSSGTAVGRREIYQVVDQYDLVRPRLAIDRRLQERLMQRAVTADELLSTYDNHPGIVRIVAAVLSALQRPPPEPFVGPDADALGVMVRRVPGPRHCTLVLADHTNDASYGSGFVICNIPYNTEVSSYPGGITGTWLRHYCIHPHLWQGASAAAAAPDPGRAQQRLWLAVPLPGRCGKLVAVPKDVEDWMGDGEYVEENAIVYPTLEQLCIDVCGTRTIELIVGQDGVALYCSPEVSRHDLDREDGGCTVKSPGA